MGKEIEKDICLGNDEQNMNEHRAAAVILWMIPGRGICFCTVCSETIVISLNIL